MKYKVDGWNNFCRVFELPKEYPNEFCFGGGHPVNFQLVDWFNPVSDMPQASVSKDVWVEKLGPIKTKDIDLEDLEADIIPFLKQKNYVMPDRQYLILYSFGGSSTFQAPPPS